MVEKELKDMFGLILTKLDGIESRLDKVESRLDGIESRLDKVESRLDKVESRLDRLESRLDRLESRQDRLESRQDEIFLVVKAIEHNNQVHRAEINNLQFKVDYIEGTFNLIGDVIITRKAIK